MSIEKRIEELEKELAELKEMTRREEKVASPEDCKVAMDALMAGFSWRDTPDGILFWHKVRNALEHMARTGRMYHKKITDEGL